MKSKSEEAVVVKSKTERQVQGERKALVWKYVRKGGCLCSFLLRMLLHVLLSSDLSHNTTKFSSVSFNFVGIQKSVEHCFKSGDAVQLIQLSLGA